MDHQIARRSLLAAGAGLVAGLGSPFDRRGARADAGAPADPPSEQAAVARIANFAADVTVPLGHPLMGGGIEPARSVADPLWARGVVLEGAGPTVVLCAVDWCEIRNAAYERWQRALAEAADTRPECVFLASVHQHDAPVADLRAEEILRNRGLEGSICDLQFHEKAVENTAAALADARKSSQPLTHVGSGQAKVERIASNRRYLSADGQVRYDRTSSTRDAAARDADEGTVDPFLKTVSFWNGDRPLAAIHFYATHPMSSYGRGEVSADFVGLARRRRAADDPRVHEIYFSGCSGNVTAGKYNDGDPANRGELADRLYRGMSEAFAATRRHALERWAVRQAPIRLKPRSSQGFTADDLDAALQAGARPFSQCLAAMGLSWLERAGGGIELPAPVIDFGPVKLLLLPGESYVEYQLYAQQIRPDAFVAVAGYGECATGYIPIERAWREEDGNLRDWCWVNPGAEQPMKAAIRRALEAD